MKRVRPTGYTVVAGIILVWAVLVTINHTWAGDMRLHLATVYGLKRDFWSPPDPLVGGSQGSPYYSPYMVVLAALATLFRAAPRTVLEWGGVFNVAFWLWALGRFCRNLSPRPVVPTLAAVFTLLLWGLFPREWSGFLGAFSLSWTMAYPSVFATALMLLIWDTFVRYRTAPSPAKAGVLALMVALIVLIHPFTALNTMIGLAAFTLSDLRVLRSWPLYAAGGVAVILALLWPWSDFAALFGAAGDLSDVHRELIYDLGRNFGFAHYGLALVGLPALIMGRDKPFFRELLILFVLAASVIGIGAAVHSYGFARVLPVAMLPLHLALAAYLADWTRNRLWYVVPVLVACGFGIYGNSGGWIRAWGEPVSIETLEDWGARPVETGYDVLVKPLRPGWVVLPDNEWAGRIINSVGAYSVVPAWPYPFVDEDARRRDHTAFFAPETTTAQRAKIVRRYRINCVIADWNSPALKKGALTGFELTARTEHGGIKLFCRR